MPRTLELEINNLICRFGETHVLNDYLEEIVLPAFFSEDTRDYGETQYFFTEQSFGFLETNNVESLSLRCRFIKNTVLRRHQIYSPTDGVVPDEKSLDSAPSSLAILLLKSHRLLYVREVPQAPSPVQFGTTFARLLRNATERYQTSLYEQRLAAGQKVTKKRLRESIPFPDVNIVPVVSSESLKHFVKRFDQLNSLKIEIAPTNSELDNTDFFKKLRVLKQNVASDKTVVQHQNSKGLNKEGCIAQVEAAKQGNALIHMRGTDSNGDELRGNNENFSVRAAIEGAADEIGARSKDAFEKFEEMVENKVVDLGKPTRDDSKKLMDIYKRFEKGGGE